MAISCPERDVTMQRSFAPGDTVRPKSGGPIMRVDRYGEFNLVHCLWLDEKGQPQSKPFLEENLEKLSFPSPQDSSSRQIKRKT
jgi:uncharacterized protein YodC (DUF2158 family)